MDHPCYFEDPRQTPDASMRSARSGLDFTRHGIERSLAVACVFLAPINTFRLDAVYFTGGDAFALAALLAMVINRSLPVASLGRMTALWNAGFILFGGALLASSLLYGTAERGFVVFGQYLYAYVILAHVVLSRGWNDTVALLKAFALSVAAVCLHGIYLVDVLGEKNTHFVSGSGRLLGLVERGNELAALIASAVPLLLWLVCSGSLRARWLWIALPLYTYAIMLTGSNTGLIALFSAIVAFIAIYGTVRQMIAMGAAMTALVWAALGWGRDFLPAIFQQRVLGALANADIDQAGTFVGRMKLIYEALGMIDGTMILGLGADRYREVSQFGAPVHNTYLLIWAEAGFPALLGFVLMLVSAVLTAVAALRMAGGRLAACCTLTSVVLFALTLNAMPHTYSRFLVVPLLLGIAPCLCLARLGPVPAGTAPHAWAPTSGRRAATYVEI